MGYWKTKTFSHRGFCLTQNSQNSQNWRVATPALVGFSERTHPGGAREFTMRAFVFFVYFV